ncbi:MAG: hypothetical protein K2J15_05150 [Muribaculaceae bacterium]|nr:hypothetical protein [Muribaculaceae bacterium]
METHTPTLSSTHPGLNESSAELTVTEKREILSLIRKVETIAAESVPHEEIRKIRNICIEAMHRGESPRNEHGLSKALLTLKSAILFAEAIDPDPVS